MKLPRRLRPPSTLRRQALAALLLYVVCSLALFGLPVLSDLSGRVIGWGVDPASHVWFLAWWPHAIASGTNPFLTHVVWAPSGYNLAGSTAMPGPSLVLAPVTALFGPVISYNVLCLAAPALSAWTAFLLCRRVTGRFAPSLVAGYLFGFSTYELGQLSGHPNLAFVALVPVAVLLVVRRLAGDLSSRRFVLFLAAVLVGQFLISTEVALTLALFGGLALVLAIALSGSGRPLVIRTTLQVGAAYLISAIPLAPYLYYAAKGASHSPIYAFYPSFYSTDALNFVIPTPLTVFGRHRFGGITAKFSGNISEQVGYLGLPALTAVVAFAVSRWRSASTRLLALMFMLVGLASLGPTIRIAGATAVAGPWAAFVHLPLVKYVLPARLMMYEALLAGLAMALWLAGAEGAAGVRRWGRWVVAALAMILLLPNLSLPLWHTRVDTPTFFAHGLYRDLLEPGEIILVIPFADRGNSMLWQAETRFAFRMAEGYVSVVPPPEFSRYPILKTLYDGELIPNADGELRAFLYDKGVTAIVVQNGKKGPWADLFGSIDPQPRSAGGVTLYRVPRSILRAPAAGS